MHAGEDLIGIKCQPLTCFLGAHHAHITRTFMGIFSLWFWGKAQRGGQWEKVRGRYLFTHKYVSGENQFDRSKTLKGVMKKHRQPCDKGA